MTRAVLRAGLFLAAGVALAAAAAPRPVAAPSVELDGRIVDAATGKPVIGAVILATWTDRTAPDAAGKTRTRERAKEMSSIVGGRFNIETPPEYADMVMWLPVRGRDPLVRVYAPGYKRLAIENRPDAWSATGKVLKLTPLAADDERARTAEIKVWKKDIEATLAASGLRGADAAFRVHEHLLLLFDAACAHLEAPPAGLCYDGDTPEGRYLARVKDERAKYVVIDQPRGLGGKYPIRAQSPAAATAASATGSSAGAGYPGYPPAKP
jgi:hypothetical protein